MAKKSTKANAEPRQDIVPVDGIKAEAEKSATEHIADLFIEKKTAITPQDVVVLVKELYEKGIIPERDEIRIQGSDDVVPIKANMYLRSEDSEEDAARVGGNIAELIVDVCDKLNKRAYNPIVRSVLSKVKDYGVTAKKGSVKVINGWEQFETEISKQIDKVTDKMHGILLSMLRANGWSEDKSAEFLFDEGIVDRWYAKIISTLKDDMGDFKWTK